MGNPVIIEQPRESRISMGMSGRLPAAARAESSVPLSSSDSRMATMPSVSWRSCSKSPSEVVTLGCALGEMVRGTQQLVEGWRVDVDPIPPRVVSPQQDKGHNVDAILRDEVLGRVGGAVCDDGDAGAWDLVHDGLSLRQGGHQCDAQLADGILLGREG
jgi:hypothetical protein